MINIIYVALPPMRAQTEMMTFSYKDDCTFAKHTELGIFHFAVFFLDNVQMFVVFFYGFHLAQNSAKIVNYFLTLP